MYLVISQNDFDLYPNTMNISNRKGKNNSSIIYCVH